MIDFLVPGYLWFKAFHIVAVVAWMAGLLYLPRLFAYHAEVPAGSAQSETFKVMERGLYRTIMTPAMIAVWILGPLTLLSLPAELLSAGWFHAKLLLVLFLTGFHYLLGRWRKDFAADRNHKPARFYKRVNEVPTVILILVVLLVVLKPF